MPIRETINITNQKLNILSENNDSLRNRVDNISREILSIVKRDLKAESNRITIVMVIVAFVRDSFFIMNVLTLVKMFITFTIHNIR